MWCGNELRLVHRFAGEDLEAAARKQRQLAQQAAWCAAQVR